MNYLEIVRAAWSRAGQSGEFASVATAAGFQRQFASYVADAWRDVQLFKDDWSFMRVTANATLIPATETVELSAIGVNDCRLLKWVQILVDGRYQEIPLTFAEQYHDQNKLSGRPTRAFFEAGKLSFDTIPDSAYTLRLHYQKVPQELVNNTDIPAVGSGYHWAIVWGAVRAYAIDDQDQSLLIRANEDYNKAMAGMCSDLMPRFGFAAGAF